VKSEEKVSFEWKAAANQKDQIRRLTFRALWSRGFYITSGEKFGGDFLVYPGKIIIT
jgi:tRNA-splicing endonuclease subunit Sen34